jgi:hypothetical protein
MRAIIHMVDRSVALAPLRIILVRAALRLGAVEQRVDGSPLIAGTSHTQYPDE